MSTFNNATKVEAVINFPDHGKTASPVLEKAVLDDLARLGKYYTILHDKFSEEEKDDETIHRHLVLEAKEGRSSKAFIDLLALIFKVDNNCVSIMSVRNFKKRVRYLCHLDDKGKYQFPRESVQTNDKRGFEDFCKGGSVSMEDIVAFEGNLIDFGKVFGLEAVVRYGRVFEMVKSKQAESNYYRWRSQEFEYRLNRVLIRNADVFNTPQMIGIKQQLNAIIDDLNNGLSLGDDVYSEDKEND